jgi:hypothetical protein
MKIRMNLLAAGAALALVAGTAFAESQYGYNAAGTGTVTATAKVNLSVTVPKLILLRVGSANTTVDTLSWTTAASIPAVPTAPVTGNNTSVNWDGSAPTVTSGTQPAAINVYAWTNASAGTLNCAVGTWVGTNNPANADFSVTVTGSLPHPGANLGACASTSFASNTVASGTWAYVLGGTPTGWGAGVHTNTVTYTAQGI